MWKVANLLMAILEKLIELIDIEYVTCQIISNSEDFGFLTNTHKFKIKPLSEIILLRNLS